MKDIIKLRKIIYKLLKEEILNEVKVNPVVPAGGFEYFTINNKESQYAFQTKNKNIYILSLIKTTMFIRDENVLETYQEKNTINKDGSLNFITINFFLSEDKPDKSAFKNETGKREPFTILSNIVYLLQNEYFPNTTENCFVFPADPKRTILYENALENFENNFYVFQSEFYDNSFDEKQMLLIRR